MTTDSTNSIMDLPGTGAANLNHQLVVMWAVPVDGIGVMDCYLLLSV